MFAYTNPSGTLKPVKALTNYRSRPPADPASTPLAGSAFTLLEAFGEVPAAQQRVDTVGWPAFPKTHRRPT